MSHYSETEGIRNVLLAAVAGASAGLLAGLLLAPAKGTATRKNLGDLAGKYRGQLDEQATAIEADLKAKYHEAADAFSALGHAGASSLHLQGDWNILKGKLKAKYAQLTDEDLAYVEGKGEELLGRLQSRLGKGKARIVELLNEL